MKDLGLERTPQRGRGLNAVALQNAVLCAECDVVSDSPHDTCLVCGSRSLLNIARMFGATRVCTDFSERSQTAKKGADLITCTRLGAINPAILPTFNKFDDANFVAS